MSINIGLDMDNTFVDFSAGFRQHVANVSRLKQEDALVIMPDPSVYNFAGWDWSYTAFSGLAEAFAHAEASAGFYELLEPFEGAVDALLTLATDGAMITAVTARSEEFYAQTIACLRHHGAPVETVLFSKTKFDLHRSHGGSIDLFFDDAPHVLSGFDVNMVPSVAFTTGYNGDSVSTHRVNEWSEVPALGLVSDITQYPYHVGDSSY